MCLAHYTTETLVKVYSKVLFLFLCRHCNIHAQTKRQNISRNYCSKTYFPEMFFLTLAPQFRASLYARGIFQQPLSCWSFSNPFPKLQRQREKSWHYQIQWKNLYKLLWGKISFHHSDSCSGRTPPSFPIQAFKHFLCSDITFAMIFFFFFLLWSYERELDYTFTWYSGTTCHIQCFIIIFNGTTTPKITHSKKLLMPDSLTCINTHCFIYLTSWHYLMPFWELHHFTKTQLTYLPHF